LSKRKNKVNPKRGGKKKLRELGKTSQSASDRRKVGPKAAPGKKRGGLQRTQNWKGTQSRGEVLDNGGSQKGDVLGFDGNCRRTNTETCIPEKRGGADRKE